MSESQRLVVCVTGASGSIYARRLLQLVGAARAGTIPGQPARPELRIDVVASQNGRVIKIPNAAGALEGKPGTQLAWHRFTRLTGQGPRA